MHSLYMYVLYIEMCCVYGVGSPCLQLAMQVKPPERPALSLFGWLRAGSWWDVSGTFDLLAAWLVGKKEGMPT